MVRSQDIDVLCAFFFREDKEGFNDDYCQLSWLRYWWKTVLISITVTVEILLMKLKRFWWQLWWNNWRKTEIIEMLLMTLTRLSEMKSPPPDGLPPLYKSSPSRARVRNHTLSLSSLSQLSLLLSLSQTLSFISLSQLLSSLFVKALDSRAHLDICVLGYIC